MPKPPKPNHERAPPTFFANDQNQAAQQQLHPVVEPSRSDEKSALHLQDQKSQNKADHQPQALLTMQGAQPPFHGTVGASSRRYEVHPAQTCEDQKQHNRQAINVAAYVRIAGHGCGAGFSGSGS